MKISKLISILLSVIIFLGSPSITIAATNKKAAEKPKIVTQQKKQLTVKEIAKKNNSVVYIEVTLKNNKGTSQGSGFLVSNDGKIVTNYHVIDNAEKIIVKLANNSQYKINKIIGYDKKKDVAVLQIDNVKKAAYVKMGDSSKVELGEDIVAVGSPLGLQNTVSTGIVSSIRKNIVREAENCVDFQISAPISHGSSGGALFNMYGEVIGITYAGLASFGGENLNFAIPINDVKPYIDSDTYLTIQQFYENEHTIHYISGDYYEGDLLNGIQHGQGTYIWANGDMYIGGWSKGMKSGQGTYKWVSGDSYTGDWVNDKKTGKGTYKWSNGDMYIGDFLDNKFSGQGTYYYARGGMYEGGFLNDAKNGPGKDTAADGAIIYGTWANGKLNGTSRIYSIDGSIHLVTWIDDKIYMIDGRVVSN